MPKAQDAVLQRQAVAVEVGGVRTRPPPEGPNLGRLREVFVQQRAKHGQTFDELAAQSGLSRQTLLNLSAGRYVGDLRTWAILARTWEINLDDLIAPIWD